MKHSPYIVTLSALSVILMGLLLFSGCGRSKTPVQDTAPQDAATAEEAAVPRAADPFLNDAARKTVAIIADASREQPSIISTDALGRLHISGIAILFVAVAARFLFGRWKDAYIAAGLGAIPSVFAVLLTEYSRVVLLIPLCGLAILALSIFKRIAEWRTKAKGFDATSTVIEDADTGEFSLGQLIKDKIGESGFASVVDKALKPLEALWSKQK